MGHGHRRQRERLDESFGYDPLADLGGVATLERTDLDDLLDYHVGDFGAICMDERPWTPPPVVLSEIEAVALTRPVGYVEFAADDAPPNPMFLVDGVLDADANVVTDRMLQRSTGGETYTRPDGSVGKKGGGGGSDSAGVAKKDRGGRGGGTGMGRNIYEGRSSGEADIDDFGVHGLTIGEVEFFHRHPGLAFEVLTDTAKQILASELKVDVLALVAPPKRAKADRPNFTIYGLANFHIFVLRQFPGAARTALSNHARAKDGERIRWREASVEKGAEPIAA